MRLGRNPNQPNAVRRFRSTALLTTLTLLSAGCMVESAAAPRAAAQPAAAHQGASHQRAGQPAAVPGGTDPTASAQQAVAPPAGAQPSGAQPAASVVRPAGAVDPAAAGTGVAATGPATAGPDNAGPDNAGSSTVETVALADGLARTPPMGWNDWNAYGCKVSEALVKKTADKLVSSGLAAAGYRYVNIDDCWARKTRDSNGNLRPDPDKFPHGISGTADYVHAKGLKLGIYADAGTLTCAEYPGSLGHEKQDARKFAAWKVDYLKYDNCHNKGSSTTKQYIARYAAMRDALAATDRDILYSICEWGINSPWTWGPGVGHLWRTTHDIRPTYASMLAIFRTNVALSSYAGPGRWNDPDMLEVGNGMTATEDRAEFSLWAQMAAPLLAGNNLVKASRTTLSILGNRAVIAVDQDSLGRQATMVSATAGRDVLAKRLANGDVSVVLFNEKKAAQTISTTVGAIGKSGASSYRLTDLWAKTSRTTSSKISARVPGHGVVMYRVSGGSTRNIPNPAGRVRGVASKRCLDVPNSSVSNGARIQIWSCNGNTNQKWAHTSGRALLAYGTKCLDADGNGKRRGTAVILWTCNGRTNQQWKVKSNGTIVGVASGLCLDVTGARTAKGTKIQLWTCKGGSNQKWRL